MTGQPEDADPPLPSAPDPADDDVLVRFILDTPGLLDALLAEHVPDRPCGGPGRLHCSVCPGVHAGRPVWPCDIHRAATRADRIRRLMTITRGEW